MSVDKQYQNLVNRLYELVVGNVQTFGAWAFYLFHSEFDGEPELRNRLGTIWICSLLDSVEAQQRFLPAIEREAAELGFESLVENSRQLGNFCILVIEFIEQYSRDEQLLLNNLRNQWVHSYFANRHRDPVQIKYCAGGRLVSEAMSNAQYSKIIRSFFETGGSTDEVLTPMIHRALDLKKHRYWYALEAWQKDHEKIYQVFRNGDTIRIDV